VVNAPIPGNLRREIICVNDCSKDGTAKNSTSFPPCSRGRFQIIHKPVNEGKGAACAMDSNTPPRPVLIQDADLEYDPATTRPDPTHLENRADVVYGSASWRCPHRVLYFWHTLATACSPP